MSAPRHLLAAWAEIERQLHRAQWVAVFTDFDGTLVRIRRHPARVQLSRRVKNLLAALVRCGVVVGVVSGRRLEELRAKVGVDRIWYAGAHGFFLRTAGNRNIVLLSPSERATVTRAERFLARRLSGVPGIALERKRATLAVHYRLASRRNREFARNVLAVLSEKEPRLSLLAGKKVWELLPAGRHGPRVDKATAIQLVLRRERQRRPHGRSLVFYLGDDTTDERIFQKLEGISVAVGKTRHTAARFFLRSPGEVRQLLRRLTKQLRCEKPKNLSISWPPRI